MLKTSPDSTVWLFIYLRLKMQKACLFGVSSNSETTFKQEIKNKNYNQ